MLKLKRADVERETNQREKEKFWGSEKNQEEMMSEAKEIWFSMKTEWLAVSTATKKGI